ncbi:2-oxoglutarate and iron-dependent oxygenase domain-containing protein [Sphingomonas sp.]|uniref:2-oxoglutarate and iron-dependent oxygenase domain-containing protein n=1 Tax=Sphingomonas sp. TaxID=28214 RepID=UPI0038AD0AB4
MTDPQALNREFEKYDQVRKAHTYRLAEDAGDEFDEEYEIATLDFGRFLHGNDGDKARFAEEFAQALGEIGFAVLTGHGVDPTLYDEIHDRVAQVFTTTPLDEKMRFRAKRHGSVNQGYFPIEETSEIHPDLVEGWVWCRRAFDVPQRRDAPFRAEDYWPRADHEPAFRRLVLAHEALFKPIAQAMFQGLGVDPDIYDRKLTDTNFGMRLNYYPPMTADQDSSGAGRLLGHEDVDLFTILPASRTDGLQVWNHRSGKWVRMRAPWGSIIINTGDYMQRITNDRLPSTTHRVGKPSDGSHLSAPRVSFPMAVYVWEDELLEVLPGLGEPKYAPIKAITFHTRSTSKFYGDDYAVG